MKRLLPFAGAIGIVAVVLALQHLLKPWVGATQLLLIYPAVLIVSWFLGFAAGVFSTVLGVTSARYFFTTTGRFWPEVPSEDFYRLITFFVMCFFVNWLIERGRRSEEELRRRDRQFRFLADTMPQLVWITDPFGKIEYINERWYLYTGQPVGSFTNETWLEATHPEDRERVFAAHREALLKGTEFQVEYRLRREDGDYRWHLARTVFVRDTDGTVIRRFGTATDVHDQWILTRELRDAVRTRDEFLSIASHELKTPLTSLHLQVQIRRRELAKYAMTDGTSPGGAFSPERVQKNLDDELRNIQRITRLVDDVLDVSKIHAGKLSIHRETFELRSMIAEICGQFRPMADAAGVSVELTDGAEQWGEWDRFRIEQVLLNLLSNALRYGGKQPIRVELAREGEDAAISVIDRGMGIAAEDQARIFDRFERAISSNEVSGMGLGLYISREIARAHGGDIRVESAPGRGARFTVRLPISVSHDAVSENRKG